MRKSTADDACHWFYKPFFDTKRGHIVGLATTSENMRDGLAISQVSRFFPLPDYRGIIVEPGRRSIRPEHNVILVGWASLFIDPDPELVSGLEAPASVGWEKLRRIERLDRDCCLKIMGRRDRAVVNTLTGKRYEPFKPPEHDRERPEVDYGVVRRWLYGPFENTIVLEGLHRLGTIGTAKAATDPVILKTLMDSVHRLGDFDDSMMIEVLVKAQTPDEIYSLEGTQIEPLLMTCSGQLVLDLQWRKGTWIDLRPWDVCLYMCDKAPALPVPDGRGDGILPRLELRADLQSRSERVRTLCRDVLIDRSRVDDAAKTELVEALLAEIKHFDIELWEKTRAGRAKVTTLPTGRPADVREERKRFLTHLILLRMMDPDPRLPCTEEVIRRNYPTVKPHLAGGKLEKAFINSIAGRTREAFYELLGPAAEPKRYLRHFCSRPPSPPRTYQLELQLINVVVKLRV